jgi:hypothetical protein
VKSPAITFGYKYGPPVTVKVVGGADLNAIGEIEDGGGGGAPVVVVPPATTVKVEGCDLSFGLALDTKIGYVTTPDTPDMAISGRVRLTVYMDLKAIGSGSPSLVFKQDATPTRELMMYMNESGQVVSLSTRNLANTSDVDVTIVQNPVPLGTHTFAMEVEPGGTVSIPIVDGVRGAPFPSAPLGLPNTAAALLIGDAQLGPTAQIHSAQMDAINRAQLMFPGVVGNYLTTPGAGVVTSATSREIVVRFAVDDWDVTPATFEGIVWRSASFIVRRSTSPRTVQLSLYGSPAVVNVNAQYVAGQFAPGQMVWFKFTYNGTTGAGTVAYSTDATEPTTWTTLISSTFATATLTHNTQAVDIGRDDPSRTFKGRIGRVIVRNGIAGPAVLDVSENNAGTMATASTFVATTGQTVTVAQTAGSTVVQPQADQVVWRFDAEDYPGTGLSYVDPRGRTWTLSAAGAIGQG